MFTYKFCLNKIYYLTLFILDATDTLLGHTKSSLFIHHFIAAGPFVQSVFLCPK